MIMPTDVCDDAKRDERNCKTNKLLFMSQICYHLHYSQKPRWKAAGSILISCAIREIIDRSQLRLGRKLRAWCIMPNEVEITTRLKNNFKAKWVIIIALGLGTCKGRRGWLTCFTWRKCVGTKIRCGLSVVSCWSVARPIWSEEKARKAFVWLQRNEFHFTLC